MDTKMDPTVQPMSYLGLCNLCMTYNARKSMFEPITNELGSETYTEMLFRCYLIDYASFKLNDLKFLICDACARRLADAALFRSQVEESLRCMEAAAAGAIKSEDKAQESDAAVDDDEGQNFEDPGSDPDYLADVKIKQDPDNDPEPRPTRKRKTERVRARQKTDTKETEALLKNGLFPFKLRKNNTYSCAVCHSKHTNLDDLGKHVTSHGILAIDVAFKKSVLNMHRFYKVNSKLRCKLCLADISDFDELKQHVDGCERLNFANNKLPFKLEKDQTECPLCKKTFLNYVSLNSHMNVHFPNYICENCGKAFASKSRLRGHVRTHEVGEFRCKYCDQVFDKVTKRENHVSREHKAGVRYYCKRCNLSLTSFYAKQKHLADVHNEELKRYKCKACSHSYITPGHLSSHVRRDHLNERNHKCTKCELAFYSSNALKMHMIKHDGERIHVCPVCNKSYQRKKTLREHLRIHDNDKRFVCPVCARAFTQKCTLKGHLKVHERKLEGVDVL